MIERAALQPLVERWLPTQRWFAGKGREATVDVVPFATLRDQPNAIEIWVADVHYDDGTSERYQVPLVMHDQPDESLEHVNVGSIDTPDGPRWVYDALHDKDATAAWLEAMRDEQRIPPLEFHRYAPADTIPLGEQSLVQTGEQSNTSVMFGDQVIMKVYRRLQQGINPDIEIHRALGEHGAKHIAAVLGSVDYVDGGAPWALAMAQEYMTTATDGWELAKTSVRDLFNERDLHAEEAGGDFAGEAMRLGVAVAETHADLVAAFGTSRIERAEVQARVEAMRGRLDAATRVVDGLADLADGIRAAYDEFEAAAEELVLQRIHGDLHLGQVLRTSNRWVVIDFEGEPMADLTARSAPDTALRDVAGMLRSFDYAGYHRLVEDPGNTQLAYRAAEWSQRNRDAFCSGYEHVTGTDPRAQSALLRAYEADKAVYETVYEARNRPSWLPIPLMSLTRLVTGEHSR